jgi:O-antigen/teichoic acid export membrane protein
VSDLRAEADGAPAEATHRPGSVGRDVVYTFSGRIGLTGVVLVSDVVLARTLGPEGKGAFLLVLVLTQLAALVCGLGLDRSLAVIAARSLDAARRAFANSIVWTVVIGGLGVVVIALLYGLPAGPGGPAGPLTAIMPPLSQAELLFGALALPGELAFAIGLVGLLGRQQVLAYNALRILRRGLLLVLLLLFVVLGRLSLELVLIFNLLALLVTAAGIGWAAHRAGMLGTTVDGALLREQIGFGSRTVVGALAERLHFRADAFLLNIIVGVAATGVYSVALGLAETLWYLPSSLGLVLFSRAVRRGRDSAAIASSMTRSMLALSLIAAVPLALAAPTAVEIVYGAPFREAGVALQLMLPGVIAYSLVAILSHFVIAWGHPGTATVVMISGLVVNLAANAVLIPQFGLVGAAISATISYTVAAVLIVLVFTRISGVTVGQALIVRRSDVWARLAEIRALVRRSEEPVQ